MDSRKAYCPTKLQPCTPSVTLVSHSKWALVKNGPQGPYFTVLHGTPSAPNVAKWDTPPPPHYFMSLISYHYQYLSKFMRVVQIACHDICPTLTPPSDPALCDAKPQPSQKSLDKSYINFQKVKYKRSKDLGALVDSCSWDDIGNFLHTCIKHSLLQTKSIEIWVNSHM